MTCPLEDRDDQRQVREKITGKLLTLDRALEPSVPAFLALFNVPIEDPEWHASDPRQRRQRTLDAIKRLLLAESRVQPLLLVFEDLHWIDTETQAFLDIFFESLPTARILVLVNYRPEYQHAWGHKTYDTGIAQISDGLTAARATGTLMPLEPLYMLVLADACVKHGRVDEALRVVDDALTMMAARGERIWHSALHRLEGELLLMRAPSDHAAAEGCFREAIEGARQQEAHAWELRAATSLCRLLGQRGRRDDARQTLGEVYGRFTEGLDTPNLRDAKALLSELA